MKRTAAVAVAISLVAAPATGLGFGIGPNADEWIRAHPQRAAALRRQQEPWTLWHQTPIEEVLGATDWRRAPAQPSAQSDPLLDVRVAASVEQILDGRFDPTAID